MESKEMLRCILRPLLISAFVFCSTSVFAQKNTPGVCQGASDPDTCEYTVMSGEEAPGSEDKGLINGRSDKVSNGVRLNEGVSAAFTAYYGRGMGRFVTNPISYGRAVFVPQKKPEEFAAFLNSGLFSTGGFVHDFAIPNFSVNVASQCQGLEFGFNQSSIAVLLDGTSFGLVSSKPSPGYSRVPEDKLSANYTKGTTAYNSPYYFDKTIPGYSYTVDRTDTYFEKGVKKTKIVKDTIYVPPVYFRQSIKINFKTEQIKGDHGFDYRWFYNPEEETATEAALYRNGVFVKNCTLTTPASSPINGECAAEKGLCSVGTPSTPMKDSSGAWTWTCSGTDGGLDATCAADTGAECGKAVEHYYATKPEPTDLCSSGSASEPTGGVGTTPFSWTCTGSAGASVACQTKAPKQCVKFIYQSGSYTVPDYVFLGGKYSIEYKIKGGGGGGPGAGGAPGGGGGATSITISGGNPVIAEGGMGGGVDHGDGGSIQNRYARQEHLSYRSWGSINRNFSLIVGGGGGAGGAGLTAGGGGGGAGTIGGGGGAGCEKKDVLHGGGGNGNGWSDPNYYGGQGQPGRHNTRSASGLTPSALDGSSTTSGAGGFGGTCVTGGKTYGYGGSGGSASSGGAVGRTSNGAMGGGGGGAQSSFGGDSGKIGTTLKVLPPKSSIATAYGLIDSIVDKDTAVGSGKGGKPGGAKFYYWAPECNW